MVGEPINPQTAAQSDPGLFDKWRAWLGSEQNRAALLQTGLSLMQPVQPGQSQFGHIASSIGEGLGAAGRTEARLRAEELAQQKLDRELSADELDREIKRSGLELDKLNTQSLIADRVQGNKLALERLGLDKSQAGLTKAKTEAEIANLQGKGDLSLAKMFSPKDIVDSANLSNKSIEETTQDYVKAYQTAVGAVGQKGQSSGGQVPPSPPAQTSSYPSPKSQAEYEALPSGTVFVAPNGSIRRKP